MTRQLLPCVQMGAKEDARWSVIWLHGLGADGHDFAPIVPELGLGPDAPVRFVFPTAPSIPVTINGGMVMPAWYDVREVDLRREPDRPGLRRSVEQVSRLLDREVARGVPTTRILLAGFSQGGAVALHLALRHPTPLAGLIALSTYLVDEEGLARERHAANHELPIFAAHGTHDPLVPLTRGEHAQEVLAELGYPVTWRTYRMQHEVCHQEIEDLAGWLAQRVQATG